MIEIISPLSLLPFGCDPSTTMGSVTTAPANDSLIASLDLDTLIPLAGRAINITSAILSLSWSTTKWSVSQIQLFGIFLAPLAYISAPMFILLHILFDFFVYTPYRTVIGILEALYPLYVVVATGCLVGAFVGGCAHLVSRRIVHAINPPRPKQKRVKLKEG
ncbi:hypothetical protein CYLTODRAFT_418305 [Cylindrobasidium torrendii FP15055 ss-10]|uniref:Uncharacterized protein n=1 Tax=Cylindrobasidium torrendii FP15055 ss-10 TaxID=1314674 RepID=A0A0D7BR74_9AGAR|nr:hypothetical protein CYLTODRAFT_418305 [Cylindrobasidium torrendii FP15055 ss-10]